MRVLSGIQPSGKLHIGNYFGMMQKMIDHQENQELYCFIANYHAQTTVSDQKTLNDNTLEAIISFLALGLDPEKSTFWTQSDIPEVTELTWILSNFTPVGLMERAHSYKDKINKGIAPNMGLFAYPILMTSDILLFQSEVVPVGKDQKQHVEMARDIATKFNNQYGEIFTIPEPQIDKIVSTVPGVDGRKMSKSYDNYIEIFNTPKSLKKKVMSIITDSTPLEAPKDPETCNVFALAKLFMNQKQQEELRQKYLTGGYGYGHAKKELLEIISNHFEPYQQKYQELMNNKDEVYKIMKKGSAKARETAQATIEKVREVTGLKY